MLTDSELAAIRSTASEALPGTAVIQGQAWVSDGGGGGSTAWTASGTVDCRLAPVGGSGGAEGVEGNRISAEAEYVVTLPFDAEVTTDSRLVIDGATYNIEAVRDRSWNATTRVEVRREVN